MDYGKNSFRLLIYYFAFLLEKLKYERGCYWLYYYYWRNDHAVIVRVADRGDRRLSDLTDRVKVMLAAAENLAVSLQEEAGTTRDAQRQMSVSPTHETAEETQNTDVNQSEASANGDVNAETAEQEDATEVDNIIWHDANDILPEGFDDDPLKSEEQWSLPWALKRSRILAEGSRYEFEAKLKLGITLWGKKVDRKYYVHISKRISEEQINRARQEHEAIKARGPYHPAGYDRPERYANNEDHPMEAREKETLAKVLHRAKMLDRPTVSCLDKKITDGGHLFGEYDDDRNFFRIFLHNRYTKKQVNSILRELQSAQPSEGSLDESSS